MPTAPAHPAGGHADPPERVVRAADRLVDRVADGDGEALAVAVDLHGPDVEIAARIGTLDLVPRVVEAAAGRVVLQVA